MFSFNVLLPNQDIMVFLSGSQWGLHNRGNLGFKGDRKAGRGTIPTMKSRSDQISHRLPDESEMLRQVQGESRKSNLQGKVTVPKHSMHTL